MKLERMMGVHRSPKEPLALCTGMFAVLVALHAAPAHADPSPVDPLVVVVRESAAIVGVSRADLTRLFLGLSRDVAGQAATPINLADQGLKMDFMQRVTGRTQRSIERHFIGLELRGEGRWPAEVPNAELMASIIVRSSAITVGWLPQAMFAALDAQTKKQLRLLPVDGKTADERDYLLAR